MMLINKLSLKMAKEVTKNGVEIVTLGFIAWGVDNGGINLEIQIHIFIKILILNMCEWKDVNWTQEKLKLTQISSNSRHLSAIE